MNDDSFVLEARTSLRDLLALVREEGIADDLPGLRHLEELTLVGANGQGVARSSPLNLSKRLLWQGGHCPHGNLERAVRGARSRKPPTQGTQPGLASAYRGAMNSPGEGPLGFPERELITPPLDGPILLRSPAPLRICLHAPPQCRRTQLAVDLVLDDQVHGARSSRSRSGPGAHRAACVPPERSPMGIEQAF